MADGRGQGVYMLHRKTRSRSWKGVAVLGALPHFVRCVCQVPTPFQRSYATAYAHPAPLRCHFPCPPLAEAGRLGSISVLFFVEGAMVPAALGKSLWGGGRSVLVYVIFRPLEVRRHLVNTPHEVRQ